MNKSESKNKNGVEDEQENYYEKKGPMCITLPPDYKIKLQEYARKKHLSASLVIQLWIEQYCL